MTRKPMLLAVILILVTTLGFTQTNLQLKFKPGEMLNYKITGMGNGTIRLISKDTTFLPTGLDTSFSINMDLNGFVSASTIEVTPEGNGKMAMFLKRIDASIGVMGQAFQVKMRPPDFDILWNGMSMKSMGMTSTFSKTDDSLAMLKEPFIFTISPKGKMLDIEFKGMEQMKNSPEFKNMNTDIWKNSARQMLPDKALNPGESWAITTKMTLPPMIKSSKEISIIQVYTFKGTQPVDKEIAAAIDVNSNFDGSGIILSFSPPTDQPFRMTNDLGLKINTLKYSMSGTSLLGLNTGNLIKADNNLSLEAEMVMDIPTKTQKNDFTLRGKGSMFFELQLDKNGDTYQEPATREPSGKTNPRLNATPEPAPKPEKKRLNLVE